MHKDYEKNNNKTLTLVQVFKNAHLLGRSTIYEQNQIPYYFDKFSRACLQTGLAKLIRPIKKSIDEIKKNHSI